MIMLKTDNYGFRDIGVVIINLVSHELGIYIGEVNLWGKGKGKAALSLAMDILRDRGWKKFCAVVHPENRRSQRLFLSLGFKKVGIGRRGQDAYEYAVD